MARVPVAVEREGEWGCDKQKTRDARRKSKGAKYHAYRPRPSLLLPSALASSLPGQPTPQLCRQGEDDRTNSLRLGSTRSLTEERSQPGYPGHPFCPYSVFPFPLGGGGDSLKVGEAVARRLTATQWMARSR